MKLVDPRTISLDVWNVFNENNALLTAGDRQRCNTMTVGWCQVGRLWNRLTCTVYVRPERYTYGFIEAEDFFTVSILPKEHKKTTMAYCGTKSGRDVDKIKECGLTLAYGAGEAPFMEEADLVLVCKKIYAQDFNAGCVLDEASIMPFYGESGGWHRCYTGEIVEAYTK